MKIVPNSAYKITLYNTLICVLIMVSLSDHFTSSYYYYYYFVYVTILTG
jgi:hypothetical protein